MNLEFLREARRMLEADMSYTDISNNLAISKANLLLMLRIEDIVRADYDDTTLIIESLESSLESFQNDNNHLKIKVDSLNSCNFLDLEKDYEDLQKDFENIEKKNFKLQNKFYKLENDFFLIPEFIRNLFLRNDKR